MAGRGIGTHMWALAADICQRLGLDMQATIHPDNIASLTSCRHGCDATIISTLSNGYLQMKCRKKFDVPVGNILPREILIKRQAERVKSFGLSLYKKCLDAAYQQPLNPQDNTLWSRLL